jgi:hypothetical protein
LRKLYMERGYRQAVLIDELRTLSLDVDQPTQHRADAQPMRRMRAAKSGLRKIEDRMLGGNGSADGVQ